MKREINIAIQGKTIGEIMLFREMANLFNAPGRGTYVEEVHGNKGRVEYKSIIASSTVTVELGDLLFFTFDKYSRELRICTMQVKYKDKRFKKFLHFRANIYQWELLYTKPTITNKGNNFPPHILNFRADYDSITAYGIFYHDIYNHDIDFLYTVPYFIEPVHRPRHPLKNPYRTYQFNCPKGLSGSESCFSGINAQEAFSICSIDIFEDQVLQGKVGAPINDDKNMLEWVLNLFVRMKEQADHPEVIEEILRAYEFTSRGINSVNSKDFETFPAAMIVVTDSREYGEYHRQFSFDREM